MSSFTKNHPFIYSFYCIICVLPFVISLPIGTKDDPFDKFIEFLSSNNCSMPKEVELPFTVMTDSVPFSYLSLPLKECKTSEAVKENNEANLLCKEVFEVIQNITCIDYKLSNSKIESGNLSTDVCQDFAAIQDLIPEQKDFLSRKFGDSFICKVMCTGKYELLCKTILWGYNTQAKLKNATLEKKVTVEEEESLEGHPNSNEIPDEEITSNLEKTKKALIKSTSVKNVASDAEPKTLTDDKSTKVEDNPPTSEDKKKESENQEEKTETMHSEKTDKSIISQPTAETVSKSSNDLSEQIQNVKSEQNAKQGADKEANEQNVKQGEDSETSRQKVKEDEDKETSGQNVKPGEDKETSGQNMKPGEAKETKADLDKNILNDKSSDLDENNINVPSKTSSKNDKVDLPAIDVNISASGAKGVENVDVGTPVQDEDNEVDVTDNKKKNKNVPNPTVPKTEEENDLKKSGQENENQGETKETKADLDSKGKDPKENEIPNGESNSKVAEPTVPSIFPDKSEDFEPQPDLKDPDHYDDSGSDGDYAKQEYDTAFNPALKKESNIKNTGNDASSQFSSGSNRQISNENFLGHESDISRNFLPARNYLPDQEDSHFFFYFLTIVLVLMAGYLIFHNKQKIIALIVEGRHERRRRSHGAGYKKLETK